MSSSDRSFTELVELHERKWGEHQYPNRPTLQQLLKCPIVAMWRVEGKFMFSAHYNADDLNDKILAMLTDIASPSWKLYKVFYQQKEIEFILKVVSPNKNPKQSADSKTLPGRNVPLLPGRNAKILPGRKAQILKRHFNGKSNK